MGIIIHIRSTFAKNVKGGSTIKQVQYFTSVSVSSLRAGDNSPFTINILSSVKDDIDHYTIFPAGTPS